MGSIEEWIEQQKEAGYSQAQIDAALQQNGYDAEIVHKDHPPYVVAGAVVIVILVVIAGAIFWSTNQPGESTQISLDPQGGVADVRPQIELSGIISHIDRETIGAETIGVYAEGEGIQTFTISDSVSLEGLTPGEEVMIIAELRLGNYVLKDIARS